MGLLYLLVILVILSISYWHLSDGRVFKGAFSLFIWCTLICVVAFFYNVGDIIFQKALIEEIQKEIREGIQGSKPGFRKDVDGHFYVDISVSNVVVRCLVDTGASDTILSQRDAIRLGIDPSMLTYNKEYNTANGKISAAPVVLRDVYLNNYHIPFLEVSVSSVRGHERSLLGMSFLRHFHFFIKEDILFLIQK